jgi:hypothetical protein
MTESVFVQVEGLGSPFTISAGLLGTIKMQRDMEVIRKVLRAIQKKADLSLAPLHVDGLDNFTVGYHVALLHSAGYIDGPKPKELGDAFVVAVKGLTWEGHEFTGAILTDDSTWSKIKDAVGPEKLINMPLKVIQDLATKALITWGSNKLGL